MDLNKEFLNIDDNKIYTIPERSLVVRGESSRVYLMAYKGRIENLGSLIEQFYLSPITDQELTALKLKTLSINEIQNTRTEMYEYEVTYEDMKLPQVKISKVL